MPAPEPGFGCGGHGCIAVGRLGIELSGPVFAGVFPGFQRVKQEGKQMEQQKESAQAPCVNVVPCPCLHSQREPSLPSLGVEMPPCRWQRGKSEPGGDKRSTERARG